MQSINKILISIENYETQDEKEQRDAEKKQNADNRFIFNDRLFCKIVIDTFPSSNW